MRNQKKRSEFLGKADKYVQEKAEKIRKHPFRQNYHFEVPSGWCNDPNGFSYQRGAYHLFYQHMPYSADPDDFVMYWGHAKSNDLIHWENLPIAIGPENNEDKMGCWSGCSFEKAGETFIYYTGLDKDQRQKQCLAISDDGINFSKYEGNPILGETLCEAGAKDFRDPFIWKHEEKYYMLLGSSKEGFGCIPLYESYDGITWEFKNFLVESLGELGTVCECPNFIEINGKYVLFISPHGMNYRKSLYLVGDFDYTTGKFFWHSYGEIDWGMDYYAPQIITDERGRKISIGWMNSWEWMPWSDGTYFTTQMGWCGGMSLPRRVWLDDANRLCSKPVEEIEILRENKYIWKDVELDESFFEIETKDNRHLERKIIIDTQKNTADQIKMTLGNKKGNYIEVIVDVKKAELIFNRTNDLQKKEGIRKCNLKSVTQKKLELHIYLDSSSIEIFSDDYATAMTNTFYLPGEEKGLTIEAVKGKTFFTQIIVWNMKEI